MGKTDDEERFSWCPKDADEPCHCYEDARAEGEEVPGEKMAEEIGEKILDLPHGAHVVAINKHPGGMEIRGISFATVEQAPDFVPESWDEKYGKDG